MKIPDILDLEKEEVIEQLSGGGSDVVTPESGGVVVRVRLPEGARLERMTATDRLFERASPKYYIYRETINVRHCVECGKKFDTRMELNRFCSPKCKRDFLDQHFDTTKCKG